METSKWTKYENWKEMEIERSVLQTQTTAKGSTKCPTTENNNAVNGYNMTECKYILEQQKAV